MRLGHARPATVTLMAGSVLLTGFSGVSGPRGEQHVGERRHHVGRRVVRAAAAVGRAVQPVDVGYARAHHADLGRDATHPHRDPDDHGPEHHLPRPGHNQPGPSHD